MDLNLTIDFESREINDIWGYHNYKTWIKRELNVPECIQGKIILEEHIDIDEDDILEIEDANDWDTFYDINTDWICIGDYNNGNHGKFDNKYDSFIEF